MTAALSTEDISRAHTIADRDDHALAAAREAWLKAKPDEKPGRRVAFLKLRFVDLTARASIYRALLQMTAGELAGIRSELAPLSR
jgi:hypothetical protein